MVAKKRSESHPARTKAATDKRAYFKQADFPQATLQQAQKIASAIVDNFAGTAGSPPDIALAIGISPTSGAWPPLTGSAIAYGLTDGGVNATTIKLTALGRKLVAPEVEGDDLVARREAIMKPRILREFFERYRRAKFPNDVIAGNVFKSLGVKMDPNCGCTGDREGKWRIPPGSYARRPPVRSRSRFPRCPRSDSHPCTSRTRC